MGIEHMDIDDELLAAAKASARQLKQKVPRLEGDLAKLEEKKSAIIAELESAQRSEHLASKYSVYINGRDRRCPRCWVANGTTAIIISPFPETTTSSDLSVWNAGLISLAALEAWCASDGNYILDAVAT